MPRGDGTGPAGMGPMTGRGAGFCAGNSVSGYANPVGGPGRGYRGRGGGRGWQNWFYATGLPGRIRAGLGFSNPVAPAVTTEQELAGLKQQAELLQDSLSQVSERIGQLEQENKPLFQIAGQPVNPVLDLLM